MDTPVLFLIFNRPDLTSRVFERIREARPRKLYIAADGPRPTKERESELCSQTRAVVETIDWPCEVHRFYHSRNLGCKTAVSSAITWFFDHEEAGIILEDDCLPHLAFFGFASEMLNRYESDDRIMLVSADNFQQGIRRGDASYYYSRFAHIWGWATWKRVWKKYDVVLKDWPSSKHRIYERLLTSGARRTFTNHFNSIKTGKLDTWDYQLSHLLLCHQGLAIMPQVNLIENLGFDCRATHTCTGSSPISSPPDQGLRFPLTHPTLVEADDAADLFTEQQLFNGNSLSLIRRLVRKIIPRSKTNS